MRIRSRKPRKNITINIGCLVSGMNVATEDRKLNEEEVKKAEKLFCDIVKEHDCVPKRGGFMARLHDAMNEQRKLQKDSNNGQFI